MPTNLAVLPARDKEEDAWRVVVETPRGSSAKYKYVADPGFFQLAHILPEGSVFPYAFGFIPSTRGADGDPIDVLLLCEDASSCGCVILSRIIGVIEGEQVEHGRKPERNDRFLAVPVASRRFASIKAARDLPKQHVKDLCCFFEDYNRVLGREFKVIRWAGPAAAGKLLARGVRKFRARAKAR